jgi:multiple sugar transport system permease protein
MVFPSLKKIAIILFLWLGAFLLLTPLIVVFWSSLAPGSYQEAWIRGNFWRAFANSTIVALSVTAIQVITSALAGYALARLEFHGKKTVSLLIIANGFSIFLMRQFFTTIPLELEQAATLDGANRWQILTRIILPLSRPALITVFLFTFIGEWNDLFKPLVFTTRPELTTVQLALASFQEQFTNRWSLLMAAVVIATLPVVVLFLLGQRQFIQGVGNTGLKN